MPNNVLGVKTTIWKEEQLLLAAHLVGNECGVVHIIRLLLPPLLPGTLALEIEPVQQKADALLIDRRPQFERV